MKIGSSNSSEGESNTLKKRVCWSRMERRKISVSEPQARQRGHDYPPIFKPELRSVKVWVSNKPGCSISTSQGVAFQGQGCLDCGEKGSTSPLIIYTGLGSHTQSWHHERTLLDTCPDICSIENGLSILKHYQCPV